MSADRSLHFESANAALMQLTKQLQQEEDKVLQVCILHDLVNACVAYHRVLQGCCWNTTGFRLLSTVLQHAEFRPNLCYAGTSSSR